MRNRPIAFLEPIRRAPIEAWVIPVFAAAYLFFFMLPVFFVSSVMQFYQYIPIMDPIGADPGAMLSYSCAFISGQSPYFGLNLYTPLTAYYSHHWYS